MTSEEIRATKLYQSLWRLTRSASERQPPRRNPMFPSPDIKSAMAVVPVMSTVENDTKRPEVVQIYHQVLLDMGEPLAVRLGAPAAAQSVQFQNAAAQCGKILQSLMDSTHRFSGYLPSEADMDRQGFVSVRDHLKNGYAVAQLHLVLTLTLSTGSVFAGVFTALEQDIPGQGEQWVDADFWSEPPQDAAPPA